MNLQELTGQESGIVIYYGKDGGRPEAVVCNWSNVQGFPRVDPFGLAVLGFGEDIPEVKGEYKTGFINLFKDVEFVFANGEELPDSGMVYNLDDIMVIAPDDWA